jgi:uncharacterized membrane protein YqjE
MLSAKEKAFVEYWEKVRESEKSFGRKLIAGLPMAMVFGLPIILFVLVIYLFFPEWYTRISQTTSGTLLAMIIAVMIAIIFFSFFRMQFKWEMNEQLYNELLIREKRIHE